MIYIVLEILPWIGRQNHETRLFTSFVRYLVPFQYCFCIFEMRTKSSEWEWKSRGNYWVCIKSFPLEIWTHLSFKLEKKLISSKIISSIYETLNVIKIKLPVIIWPSGWDILSSFTGMISRNVMSYQVVQYWYTSLKA